MKITEQRFEQFANEGKSIDATSALILLTKAYISQCGVSLGNRSVVYSAAQEWQEKLAWEDSALAVKARKLDLFELMPLLTKEYDPNVHDKYGIDGLSKDEFYRYTLSILEDDEFDEKTNQVICYGVKLFLEEKPTFQPYKIEKKITDSTGREIVLTGIVDMQSIHWTSVKMVSPYQISGLKPELIKNTEGLLEKMYYEYLLILSREKEIRSLYPIYKDKLRHTSGHPFETSRLMKQVLYPLLDEDFVIDFATIIKREFALNRDCQSDEI